ncbi:MAG: dTDP-4-amino-4,6-dideoxygalactose transaminase [Deltaproteobacteria bacterium]|nr:dTDP-4-amino-4,6-dideoxygalactose transaminase [Deltaproteobacteria bacterium]
MSEQEKFIDFNRPYMTGKELYYIAEAHFQGKLAGDGPFTKRCHGWLESTLSCQKALLTHSCTAALEMSALLLDIKPGDEIIVPSFTFVSTANAFVLRGAVPVFIDIRPDTLNIDESLLENALTEKTKAVVPVHYAGVGAEMDSIMALAKKHDLLVVEDAAQGLLSKYKDRFLGTIGHLGTISFHETKNIRSGECGALLLNHKKFNLPAEIFREKGTNRSEFYRGEVDKYTWQSMGSSFLPGELVAAFLWAQMEEAESIIAKRKKIWDYYHLILEPLEASGLIRRPIIPDHCLHNGHIYYLLLNDSLQRDRVLETLKSQGVQAVFHYIPLHSSPAGKKIGRVASNMSITDQVSEQLIRLPLWIGMREQDQDRVKKILQCL